MTNVQKIHQRNRFKRLGVWIAIYLLVFGIFLAVILHQSSRVNTLGFAAGQIGLTVSNAKYTVGQTVDFTIINQLDKPITLVENCPNAPLHVYQWESNQWVSIHSTSTTIICSNQLGRIVIQPNATYKGNYSNWPQLFAKPGIYRLVAFADNYTSLPYVDFEVVAKPTPVTPTVIIQQVFTPIYLTAPTDHSGGGGGTDN